MTVTAADILSSLFNPDEKVCLRLFDDKKRGIFKGAKIDVECGKFLGIVDELKKHNAQDRGIFYVVNYGGQSDELITRINAQFTEMDSGSFEEQQAKIDAFQYPPSMIIKTKKSLHVYWFMDNTAKVELFTGIQKALVKHFDGDPLCVNKSRVMRLPGFMHCKTDDKVEVTCISFHPERRYTQEQLIEVLPHVEEKPTEQLKGSEKGLNVVLKTCDFLKHCVTDAKDLSEHDWYAMITNLAPFAGGAEMIHELSKPYPKYNEAETTGKINHFIESGTKPITCKVIAEKGFKCPKLEKGECDCKSPAALCFKPISSEVLTEMIGEIPITNDTVSDMKALTAFIETYMYNQERGMAETLITVTMKNRFKLTVPLAKSLVSTYRECAKAYQQGLKSRRSKVEETSVPDWYDVGDHGLRFKPGVLAGHMAENLPVIFAAEQFFEYRDGAYREMPEMVAQKHVQDKMLPDETKMREIVDAEKQWALKARRENRELNPNPYLINVRNGLYSVIEDVLSPHSPDYLSTVQLNVSYDGDADCPLFKAFLLESMDGDKAQVDLIQEMLGYFLVPITSAQKSFVIVGAAGAGKSVLLRVINEILLGRENVSNVSWQSLNERFKTAELFGKLANIFADLPTKNIDDNGIFKALVGEDYLTVERKNQHPFAFMNCARLLFSCNAIPRNYGDRSEGFYRRLIIIRFSHSVDVAKRDPHLVEKFGAEADGIFMFALEGLKRLINNGFKFSETDKNRDELQQYREDSDSILSFVRDCCVLDPNGVVGSTEFYTAYKNYCDESGMKAYAQKTFIQGLITAYPDISRAKDTTGNRRILRCVRISDNV